MRLLCDTCVAGQFNFPIRPCWLGFWRNKYAGGLRENPPDYIVSVQRDGSGYGVPFFNLQKGFGYDVMQWVRQNYSPCGVVDFASPTTVRIVAPQGKPVEPTGSETLQSGPLGIQILKHLPTEMPPGQKIESNSI